MADVEMFSNKPRFCTKPLSTSEALTLKHFDIMLESNLATTSYAKCGDPLQQTQWVRNVVHNLIRCGGENIDLNFMMDMFPASDPTMVDSLKWYNRYMCDPDYNIFSSNIAVADGPGQPVWFQLSRGNHGGGGTLGNLAEGYILWDKDRNIMYTVTDVDTTNLYGHRVQITPNDKTVIASIRPNTAYLVSPAQLVGGCSCPVVSNSLNTVGYVQQLAPLKVRKDWRLCIDAIMAKPDLLQYAVVFDMQGRPVDNFMVKQEQDMRLSLRMALNMLAFMGSPTTNEALLSTNTIDARIDGNYTGFYGLIPSVVFGGGNEYNIRADRGFDFETDFEPLALYQGSRKKTRSFMVWHGQKFGFDKNDRANKLVRRTDVGANEWEAFRRVGGVDANGRTDMIKLGVRGYEYEGFKLDFKEVAAWSDTRYMGNDKWNGSALFIPQDGVTENGKAINPLEFYNVNGTGEYNGRYKEIFVDERYTTRCEYLSGYATETLAMGLHCPDQWILATPVRPY